MRRWCHRGAALISAPGGNEAFGGDVGGVAAAHNLSRAHGDRDGSGGRDMGRDVLLPGPSLLLRGAGAG